MSISKFINKVGIELEAAWKTKRNDLVIDESFSPNDFSPEYKSVGELVSKPIASKEEMFNWLEQNWPDETCHKCAMHVHFSLNHLNYYSACMSTQFYDSFLNEMKKWGESYNCRNELFWQRLNGQNRYCKKRFNPDIQVKYREKGHNRQDRRDHWNFCWGLHQTMECRLLPMFKNIQTAKSAIDALINFIDNFLEKHTAEEKHIIDELFDFDCDTIEKKPIFSPEDEQKFQELSNTIGLSPEQMFELCSLNTKRKIHFEKPKQKSPFKFNFFQSYNPEINKDIKFNPARNKTIKNPSMSPPKSDKNENMKRFKPFPKEASVSDYIISRSGLAGNKPTKLTIANSNCDYEVDYNNSYKAVFQDSVEKAIYEIDLSLKSPDKTTI